MSSNTPELYARLKAMGICVACHREKAPEGFATCQACRDARKDYRATLTRAKLCTYCKRKALPDLKVCASHRSWQNKRQKRIYKARRDAGLCRRCGVESSKTRCETCLKDDKRYVETTQRRRQRDGLCIECGKEIAILPHLLGEKCRSKKNAFCAQWHQKKENATRVRADRKKRRARLVKEGLCVSCGKRRVLTRTRKDGKIVVLRRCAGCLKVDSIGRLLKNNRARGTMVAAAIGV